MSASVIPGNTKAKAQRRIHRGGRDRRKCAGLAAQGWPPGENFQIHYPRKAPSAPFAFFLCVLCVTLLPFQAIDVS
jgi:hypothetical protein